MHTTIAPQPTDARATDVGFDLTPITPNIGAEVNSIDLDQFTEPNKRPDGTPHKFDVTYKNHPRKGYIGLQDHGSPCWFKNIKLRPLE